MSRKCCLVRVIEGESEHRSVYEYQNAFRLTLSSFLKVNVVDSFGFTGPDYHVGEYSDDVSRTRLIYHLSFGAMRQLNKTIDIRMFRVADVSIYYLIKTFDHIQ